MNRRRKSLSLNCRNCFGRRSRRRRLALVWSRYHAGMVPLLPSTLKYLRSNGNYSFGRPPNSGAFLRSGIPTTSRCNQSPWSPTRLFRTHNRDARGCFRSSGRTDLCYQARNCCSIHNSTSRRSCTWSLSNAWLLVS